MRWARALGFFLGIPTLLVAAILSMFGVKVYFDLSRTLEKVTVERAALETTQKRIEATHANGTQLSAEVDKAAGRIRKLNEEATALGAEIARARTHLAALPRIEGRQRDLETDLSDVKSYMLRDRQRKLDTLITQYRRYLDERGLPRLAKVPEMTTGSDVKGALSHYDADKNQIVIGQRVIDDDSVVLRAFTHHYLRGVTPVTTVQSEALSRWSAVESTVAFYLPASFLKNPLIGAIAAKNLGQRGGAPYLYNLNNAKTVAEFRALPPAQWPYAGAEILGAVLWSVREAIGRENADGVLVKTWIEFARVPSKADFANEFFRLYLAKARGALDSSTAGKVTSVLAARGVQL